jgi:hypothetical protein
MLETDRSNACFWTYFGFESDLLAVRAASLRISGQDFSSLIDLDLPVRNTPP